MNAHPVQCPYCGHSFDAMPARKRKCPSCKQVVCPKSTPEHREKRLMTEAQADEAERLWEQYQLRQRALSTLSTFGLDQTHLEKQLKSGARSDTEAVAALLRSVAESAKDLHDRKMAFYQLAVAAEGEGLPYQDYLAHVAKSALLRYQQSGVRKVEILSAGHGNACPRCQLQNGRILTVSEALREMPIPYSGCTQTLTGGTPGFCRCCYVAAFD